jgi:methylmalonyl-CoA/ethylmalonyl-CoA epimerase
MPARLSHVAIIVPNLEQACLFYAGLVGAQSVAVMQIPELGVRNAFVAVGERVYFEIIETADGNPLRVLGETLGHGQQMLAMECDDLDQTVAELRAAGADVVSLPPTTTLPFPRGWVRRAVRGDCPMELCPAGAVGDLVATSTVVSVADLAAG